MTSDSTLISGGYCLARPTHRLDWLLPALPEFVLSGSGCLTEYVDDNALTGCMPHTEGGVREMAEQLGRSAEDVRSIQDLFVSMCVAGEFEYPRYFTTPAAARRLVPLLGRWTSGLTLVGMSTLPGDAAAIISGLNSQRTYEAVLARNQPPEPGEVLGWDVLGTDYSDFHSWFCGGADKSIPVSVNAHGFIDSLADAQRVADYCNIPNNAEPGHWAPWQIRRYPL